MKVEIQISADIIEPYAVIHTNTMNEQIQQLVSILEAKESVLAVNENEKIVVLQPDEIYMIHIENSEVIIYCQHKKYSSKKRLYEIGRQLGTGFMQISKATFVNLKQIDSVEPFFNGMMNLKLKNGCSEYISRKYLPNFKKYLGI